MSRMSNRRVRARMPKGMRGFRRTASGSVELA